MKWGTVAYRFQHPEDWVLREVAYGLEHNKGAFVLVLFDTTAKDAYRDLPMSLAGMPAIQGHELTRCRRWMQDADRLAFLIAMIAGHGQSCRDDRVPDTE